MMSPSQGTQSPTPSLIFFQQLIPLWPHSPFARFDGVKDDALLRVLHGTAKEDKGKELTFKGFKYLPPMDVEDTEVSPLHIIFY